MHHSTTSKSQDPEADKMSKNRWTRKEEVGCVHSGIILSHEKERDNSNCSDVRGPCCNRNEWSRSEKKKKTNTIIAEIIELRPMNQVNKQKRLTKLENKFRVTQKGENGEK